MSPRQIPVTVLTGYLGAGKTTLLNRILSEPHGRKYAVIINEFGELGVDADLVVDADEEVFEMNNGCICCTVRGDLIRIIGGLMKRGAGLDGMLIETTGLADPAPVAQTFFADEDVKARTRLDAIVTVVDACHFHMQADRQREAIEQVAFADIIVLNKTDLVSAEALKEVIGRLRRINPYAEIHTTSNCQIGLDKLLDRGAFDLERILARNSDFLAAAEPEHTHDHHDHTHDHDHHDHDHDHHDHDHDHNHDHARHDDGVISVSLASDRPVLPEAFQLWLSELLRVQGQDIFRTKGLLHVSGEKRRYVFQGVHMQLQMGWGTPWKRNETPSNRLVFIGRNLDRAALRAGFESCLA